MNKDDITISGYLDELYRVSGGDTEARVSMHEIGISIGLDHTEAGKIAENLMVQGLVELKTLAGGIAITDEGLAFLGLSPASPAKQAGESLHLSDGPEASPADHEVIEKLLTQLKKTVAAAEFDYQLLEELVIDIKTLEIQLLSPRAKITIIREILRSLHSSLTKTDQSSDPLIAELAALAQRS
jgi:hypothetical protein